MESMENNIIKGLKEKYPIDELVKFNELDISEKIRENTGLILKFRDLYHQSLSEMDRLTDLSDKLSCERYHFYRFEANEGWTKPEIEKHCLPGDKKMVQMKKILRKQEIKLRFFEMAWKAFENRTWAMKLFVETLKGY